MTVVATSPARTSATKVEIVSYADRRDLVIIDEFIDQFSGEHRAEQAAREVCEGLMTLAEQFVTSGALLLAKGRKGYNVPAGHVHDPSGPVFRLSMTSDEDGLSTFELMPGPGCERITRGEWDVQVGLALFDVAYQVVSADKTTPSGV